MVKRTAKRLGAAHPRSRSTYLRRIQVDYNSSGDLVVEVWTYSQTLARDWAQAMVKEYMLYRDEKRQEQREATVQTYTREAAQIRKMVSEALQEEITLKDTPGWRWRRSSRPARPRCGISSWRPGR